jgi:hypothetical protein
MTSIIWCKCGAEYKRTDTKFLVTQRVRRSAMNAGPCSSHGTAPTHPHSNKLKLEVQPS